MCAFVHKEINVKAHHQRQQISSTRAKYRGGRRATAVKVYTVNQESSFLLIQGVPSVGAGQELQTLCEKYGKVELNPLHEYPCEEFTEAYLAVYNWFPAARTAKKHLDDISFFGGALHVCYAPEFESVEDTRRKLQDRRKFVSKKTNQGVQPVSKTDDSGRSHSKRLKLQNSETEKTVQIKSHLPVTYIWAGKEYTVYPEQQATEANASVASSSTETKITLSTQLVPRSVSKNQRVVTQQKKWSTDYYK